MHQLLSMRPSSHMLAFSLLFFSGLTLQSAASSSSASAGNDLTLIFKDKTRDIETPTRYSFDPSSASDPIRLDSIEEMIQANKSFPTHRILIARLTDKSDPKRPYYFDGYCLNQQIFNTETPNVYNIALPRTPTSHLTTFPENPTNRQPVESLIYFLQSTDSPLEFNELTSLTEEHYNLISQLNEHDVTQSYMVGFKSDIAKLHNTLSEFVTRHPKFGGASSVENKAEMLEKIVPGLSSSLLLLMEINKPIDETLSPKEQQQLIIKRHNQLYNILAHDISGLLQSQFSQLYQSLLNETRNCAGNTYIHEIVSAIDGGRFFALGGFHKQRIPSSMIDPSLRYATYIKNTEYPLIMKLRIALALQMRSAQQRLAAYAQKKAIEMRDSSIELSRSCASKTLQLLAQGVQYTGRRSLEIARQEGARGIYLMQQTTARERVYAVIMLSSLLLVAHVFKTALLAYEVNHDLFPQ